MTGVDCSLGYSGFLVLEDPISGIALEGLQLLKRGDVVLDTSAPITICV